MKKRKSTGSTTKQELRWERILEQILRLAGQVRDARERKLLQYVGQEIRDHRKGKEWGEAARSSCLQFVGEALIQAVEDCDRRISQVPVPPPTRTAHVRAGS
jgi:hypothetical protein